MSNLFINDEIILYMFSLYPKLNSMWQKLSMAILIVIPRSHQMRRYDYGKGGSSFKVIFSLNRRIVLVTCLIEKYNFPPKKGGSDPPLRLPYHDGL